MAKTKASVFEKPAPIVDEEDAATLAAIDEGVQDAKAGRTASVQQVRELLPKWIASSSSRKER
jgi:predicted transcriptional regulator